MMNEDTITIAKAIIEMTDAKSSMWKSYFKTNEDKTRLYVTRMGIYRYVVDVRNERMREAQVVGGICNLMPKAEPDVFEGVYYYEIDVPLLSLTASKLGYKSTYIQNMHLNAVKKTEGNR